jgi:hypothetical protein
VPLELGRKTDDVGLARRLAEQRVRAEQAGDDGRSARAEPGGERNADVASDLAPTWS